MFVTHTIPPVGENIPTKNPTGINQHSRTTDILENISRPKSLDYGTSSAYRIAKLKRDCPEVADRLCKGEFEKNQRVIEKSVPEYFSIQPIEIARLLGWTKSSTYPHASHTPPSRPLLL